MFAAAFQDVLGPADKVYGVAGAASFAEAVLMVVQRHVGRQACNHQLAEQLVHSGHQSESAIVVAICQITPFGQWHHYTIAPA